jgi:hypothetical protein
MSNSDLASLARQITSFVRTHVTIEEQDGDESRVLARKLDILGRLLELARFHAGTDSYELGLSDVLRSPIVFESGVFRVSTAEGTRRAGKALCGQRQL